MANEFFLQDGGAGPSLKFMDAAFEADQFGEWTPIGVEQTAGGYQVAWKFGDDDQYIVWNTTDANGNFTGQCHERGARCGSDA